MNIALPLTVYYNTRCPVCDYGIGKQKSRRNRRKGHW